MNQAEVNSANLSTALEFYGELAVHSELKLIRAPVNISVFNIALPNGFVREGELDSRLKSAGDHFARLGTPWSIWLCADQLERQSARRLDTYMASKGMQCVADVPGMELSGLPQLTRPLPKLDVRRARDLPTRKEFAELIAHSFAVPPSAATVLYTRESAWTPQVRGWVGYHLGQPVVTTVSVTDDNCIGLYSISTHTQFRRHGFAEALMRHAMEEATQRTGLTRFVLQSSLSGLKLYRKMGFRRVTRFLVFATA